MIWALNSNYSQIITLPKEHEHFTYIPPYKGALSYMAANAGKLTKQLKNKLLDIGNDL